jgi:heme-degrading monooxygenase HmoA
MQQVNRENVATPQLIEAEGDMAVKVFIKRYFKKGKTEAAVELLKDVRSHALKQPGYISGETLINHYDPCNVTVVSTWQSIEDWVRWQESDERAAKEDQLERLQEPPVIFEIYDFGRVSGK